MAYTPDVSVYIPYSTCALYVKKFEITKDSIKLVFTKKKTKALKFKSESDFNSKLGGPEVIKFFKTKIIK